MTYAASSSVFTAVFLVIIGLLYLGIFLHVLHHLLRIEHCAKAYEPRVPTFWLMRQEIFLSDLLPVIILALVSAYLAAMIAALP